MADDNILRTYRSNDPSRRNADTQSQSALDPLAELARLIGQTDPFLEAGRGASHGIVPREPQIPQPPRSAPAGDWRQHIERPNYDAMPEQPMPPPEPDFASLAPAAPLLDYSHVPQERDPYRMASPLPQTAFAEPEARREPQFAAPGDYPDERRHPSAYHHAPETPDQQGARGDDMNDIYDDPPRRRRSSGLVTAVVLIGCAMLGTAGAYGYRTYTSSVSTAPAPVITADTAPSKIVPAPADPKSTRSQERFGSGGEKLVSREEQPVTIQPGSGSPPRVVFPALAPTGNPSPPPAASVTSPPSTGSTKDSSGSTEPKRVRTLTIRPDGSDPSARPAAPVTGGPKAEQKQVPSAKVIPPPRGNAAPPRGSTGPLSLEPSSSPETIEAPRPQQRALTPPAPKETPRGGPNLASVTPNGGSGGGGYLVQVSSQRSEAEAKASYRALQAKYSQLKSRQPIVRRADVGSKGTYYRAFVGPFGSAGEASQFCDQLKSAGGQCIILRN